MNLKKKLTITIFLMVTACLTATAQNIQVPKAYMFGFVASFNDSTVYFTDIQEIDSVWVTKKKNFLAGKSNYSYQLRNYFAQVLNLPHRTVVVVSSLKRSDVEKKYKKMQKQYTSTTKSKKKKSVKNYEVKYINQSDFKFTAVDMGNDEPTTVEKPRKEKKQKKGKPGKKPASSQGPEPK